MATVVQILTDIDLRLPNTFLEATKVLWLNDIQRKIAKELDTQAVYEFIASSSVEYALATNIRLENVLSVYTGDSTVATSTVAWTEHDWSGEEVPTGNKYFTRNETFNSTSFNTITLYPYSTDERFTRIYYDTLLTDLTTTATPTFNAEYHDTLKYGVMEIIAKSGNNPDIDLANNYHAEYRESIRRIKKDRAVKRWKRPRIGWKYEPWR